MINDVTLCVRLVHKSAVRRHLLHSNEMELVSIIRAVAPPFVAHALSSRWIHEAERESDKQD